MTLTGFLQRLLIVLLRLTLRLFLGYRVIGQKNLKNLKPPFIIISNHMSALDPFFETAAFPVFSKIIPIKYVAKRELFEQKGIKKIVGIVVSALGGFKVERGVGLEKTLAYPLSVLQNGGVILIYPTGMREKRGRPRKARRGAAYLALKTGVPILPIAIRNAKGIKFDPKGFIKGMITRKLKRRGLTVLIAKPFYLSKDSKYPDDLDKARDITEKVLSNIRKLKAKKTENIIEVWKEWVNTNPWFD